MRTVEAKKFLGVKVWEDEDNFTIWRNVIPNTKEENKHKLLEFKSIEEMDEFIKWLKKWRKNMDDC